MLKCLRELGHKSYCGGGSGSDSNTTDQLLLLTTLSIVVNLT